MRYLFYVFVASINIYNQTSLLIRSSLFPQLLPNTFKAHHTFFCQNCTRFETFMFLHKLNVTNWKKKHTKGRVFDPLRGSTFFSGAHNVSLTLCAPFLFFNLISPPYTSSFSSYVYKGSWVQQVKVHHTISLKMVAHNI